jgi:hypothetical protein
MSLSTLTDEQRDVLSKVIDMRKEALCEGASATALTELSDSAQTLVRLSAFGDGAALGNADRSTLTDMLARYRDEAIDGARSGAAHLPRLEGGDTDLVYAGYTQEESVAMLKSYIARHRSEASACDAVLALLGQVPAGDVAGSADGESLLHEVLDLVSARLPQLPLGDPARPAFAALRPMLEQALRPSAPAGAHA